MMDLHTMMDGFSGTILIIITSQKMTVHVGEGRATVHAFQEILPYPDC